MARHEEWEDDFGWEHAGTSTKEIFVDAEADDNGHFTFNPATFNLHTTFVKDKRRTHRFFDEGIGGLT